MCLSLEGRGHGSLLCELLGVQGFSEGWCLVGVGGNYGSSVGDGVRRGSCVTRDRIQVLPCEQIGVAASQEAPQCAQCQNSLLGTHRHQQRLLHGDLHYVHVTRDANHMLFSRYKCSM